MTRVQGLVNYQAVFPPEVIEAFGVNDSIALLIADEIMRRWARFRKRHQHEGEQPDLMLAGSMARGLSRPGDDVDLYYPKPWQGLKSLIALSQAVMFNHKDDPFVFRIGTAEATWGGAKGPAGRQQPSSFGFYINVYVRDRSKKNPQHPFLDRVWVELNPAGNELINQPEKRKAKLSRLSENPSYTYLAYPVADWLAQKFTSVIQQGLAENDRTLLAAAPSEERQLPEFRGKDFFDLIDVLCNESISFLEFKAAFEVIIANRGVGWVEDFIFPQDPVFQREYERLADRYGNASTPKFADAVNSIAIPFFEMALAGADGIWHPPDFSRYRHHQRHRGERRTLEHGRVAIPPRTMVSRRRLFLARLKRADDAADTATRRFLPPQAVEKYGISVTVIRSLADEICGRINSQFDIETKAFVVGGSTPRDSLRGPRNLNLFRENSSVDEMYALFTDVIAGSGVNRDVELIPDTSSLRFDRRQDNEYGAVAFWVDIKLARRQLDRVWVELFTNSALFANEPELWHKRLAQSGTQPFWVQSKWDHLAEKLLLVQLMGLHDRGWVAPAAGKPTPTPAEYAVRPYQGPRRRGEHALDLVDALAHWTFNGSKNDQIPIDVAKVRAAYFAKAAAIGVDPSASLVLPVDFERSLTTLLERYADGLMPAATAATQIVNDLHEVVIHGPEQTDFIVRPHELFNELRALPPRYVRDIDLEAEDEEALQVPDATLTSMPRFGFVRQGRKGLPR